MSLSPVGILTKNSWILKDKDVLQEMAKKTLVSAMVPLHRLMKTCGALWNQDQTAQTKTESDRRISNAGVRMGIMMGPMIPGLNEHEMQRIISCKGLMVLRLLLIHLSV